MVCFKITGSSPMLLFILISYFALLNADRVAEHVRKYLNRSVNACDDFQRHLCAGNSWEYPSVETYRDIYLNIDYQNTSDVVIGEIMDYRGFENYVFNETAYRADLKKACSDSLPCYVAELQYYFNLYNATFSYEAPVELDARLQHFYLSANYTEEDVPKLVTSSAGIIRAILKKFDSFRTHVEVEQPYISLWKHVIAMRVALEKNLVSKTRTRRLKKLAEELRNEIEEFFKKTGWMQKLNEFGLDLQYRAMNQLKDIHFSCDFDDLENSMRYWENLLENFSSKYLVNRKYFTGSDQVDHVNSLHSANLEMERTIKTPLEQSLYYRALYIHNWMYDLQPNYNYINMKADEYYPQLDRTSSKTTIYAFGARVARKFLLAFTKSQYLNESSSFMKETNCYSDHYIDSFSNRTWPGVINEPICHGCVGKFEQFRDFAADIEGLRVAYSLMRKKFGDDKMKEFEYPELQITKQQAFFYAHGYSYCQERSHKLNSIVSQLDEFADAFGCSPEDREYTASDETCRLFGERAQKG